MIHLEREYKASLAYRAALRADREHAQSVSGLDQLAREWKVGGIERALAAVEDELTEYHASIAQRNLPRTSQG